MPFEQNDLVWCHPVKILPFVIRVIFDPESFSLTVRIDVTLGSNLSDAPLDHESVLPINTSNLSV